jgi:hypothetical protein
MNANFMMITPKCPTNGDTLEGRIFNIKVIGEERSYSQHMHTYCKKCKGYHYITEGVETETDEKNVALAIIKQWKKSYELSDIESYEVKNR